MNAGDLDRRVSLWRPTPTIGPLGSEVPGWTYAGAVWASKQDLRDSERVAAAQVGTVITTRFQVRRSSLTAALDPSWQLELDGVRYAITGAKEIGRREGRELTANALAEAAQR